MRCPKCGYISFDNLDACLKCKKDISGATQAFQGSTLKVNAPAFLRVPVPEEDGLQIEGAAEVDGEIEFTDPDLEILVDEDEEQGDIDFNLDADDDDLPLAGDFDEIATFGDEDSNDDAEFSADLGQFEDVPEEDSFSFADIEDEAEESDDTDFAGMDLPDELNDISDLSRPASLVDDKPNADPIKEPEAQPKPVEEALPAEPEDDLDFSNMDFDLNGIDEVTDSRSLATPATSEDVSPAAHLDMGADLDFDLDLGGLTITDEKK